MLLPTRYTKPLSEAFTSDADWLLPIARIAWKGAYGKDYEFDEWQEDLVRRILETKPDGTLRWRQCLVSMPRQQGKSEIGGILGLYSLLRKEGVTNVGVASNADQARLVQERLLRVVQANPALSKLMTKITDTRGIVTKNGTKYIIRASSAGSLQGIPVSVALVDEVHLVDTDVYTALVSGTGARKDTLVIGITTAGDEGSELLKSLYDNAEKAINGELEGFGAFIWEASEAIVPEKDEDLLKLLMESNPALESGRLDAATLLQDVRTLPDTEVIRYRLNRFVNTEDAVFLPVEVWSKCARGLEDKLPEGRPVFAIDRSPDWGFATITATIKDKEGMLHTEVVASIVKPNLEQLMILCMNLAKFNPLYYAMDGYGLKELGNELKKRGLPTFIVTQVEIINASSMFYSKAAQQKLIHANDPLISVQLKMTGRKQIGEHWRISRKNSSVEIDAVMSTVIGVYVCERQQEQPLGIW